MGNGNKIHIGLLNLDSFVSNVGGSSVVKTGDIMTMPGLPKIPAANSIKLNSSGEIEGLF